MNGLWSWTTKISRRFCRRWLKRINIGMKTSVLNTRIPNFHPYLNWANFLLPSIWHGRGLTHRSVSSFPANLDETEPEEAEWICSRYGQLSFIAKKRFSALYHGKCYQKRNPRAYDGKVKSRNFIEADQVFQKMFPFNEGPYDKLGPNYEDLNLVTKVLVRRSFVLSKMDGGPLPKPM